MGLLYCLGAAAGAAKLHMSHADAIRERLRQLGESAQQLRETLARGRQRMEELRGEGRFEEMQEIQDYIETLQIRLDVVQELIDELLGQL